MSYEPLINNFGIHSATFTDIADPSYWGMAKVVGSAEVDLKPELIKLTGGSAKVPWAVAPGMASGEISLPIRQYNKQILRFLKPWTASAETETSAGESGGSVTTIANALGTSVVNATTGIASIAVGTAADLKVGNYKVVATGAATIDIYIDTDIGGSITYQNDDLKINDSAITIPSGSTVEYQGITFNGGSGTIGLTTGDIATFTVNPISTYLLESKVGQVGAYFREFKLTIYSENVGGRVRTTTYPRCIGTASTPLNFLENEYSAMEATIQILQPSVEDYISIDKYINK